MLTKFKPDGDDENVPATDVVGVGLGEPEQNVFPVYEKLALSNGVTVTVDVAVAVHPFPFV